MCIAILLLTFGSLGSLNGAAKGAYRPSALEEEWFVGDATGRICEISERESQLRGWSQLLKDKGNASSPFFSRIKQRGKDGFSPIEPLSGVARHPFAKVCNRPGDFRHQTVNIMNLHFLKIETHCSTSTPPPQRAAVFFDMGCGSFDKVRSSIPIFKRMYAESCINFRKIIAWEAELQKNWYGAVPQEERSSIEFHNEPVDAAKFESHLLQNVKEDDFVAVKLDIDNTPAELSILEVVFRHASLIDEFFFEYHFYFDGLNFGWGNLNHQRHVNNVTTALKTMRRLREAGMRAHFWV